MSKITLDVNSTNTSTVLTILNNLKSGLINDIKVDGVSKNGPKPVSQSSKYASPSEYKKRLTKR